MTAYLIVLQLNETVFIGYIVESKEAFLTNDFDLVNKHFSASGVKDVHVISSKEDNPCKMS